MHSCTCHKHNTLPSCTSCCTHHSVFCQRMHSHNSPCSKSQCTCTCSHTFHNSDGQSSHSHISSCSNLARGCSSNGKLLETCHMSCWLSSSVEQRSGLFPSKMLCLEFQMMQYRFVHPSCLQNFLSLKQMLLWLMLLLLQRI